MTNIRLSLSLAGARTGISLVNSDSLGWENLLAKDDGLMAEAVGASVMMMMASCDHTFKTAGGTQEEIRAEVSSWVDLTISRWVDN